MRPIITDTIRLSLGGQCHFNCAYCFLPAEPEPSEPCLGLALWQELLTEARQSGFRAFSFFGKEPLASFDTLMALISHGHSLGLEYEPCYTNGWLLYQRQDWPQQFERLKAQGILDFPFAISLDEEKLQQFGQHLGASRRWDPILKVLQLFQQHYPEGQLEFGRVTIHDRTIHELLTILDTTVCEIHKVSLQDPQQRETYCYAPFMLQVEDFMDFSSLQHAYVFYLRTGGQILVHNREFSTMGKGQAYLDSHPHCGLQDAPALHKPQRDTIYISRAGQVYLSYLKFAQGQGALGHYQQAGDLQRLLTPYLQA